MKQQKKIAICICTLKRHKFLENLLEKINEQQIDEPVTVKINVVDNDPEGSSQALVLAMKSKIKYDIEYAIELQRGIPFSRNRAVSMVDADTDFVIFTDDDTYPDKLWLKYMLEAQAATDADVVSGPDYPTYLVEPPKWVVKGEFFIRQHIKKMQDIDILPRGRMSTANLLIRYQVLKKMEGPFNETLGLIGCDDTDLGLRLYRQGYKMIFAKKAVIYEWIPKQRASFYWILQRNFRTGNTVWILQDKHNFVSAVKVLLNGLVRVGVGIVLFFPYLVFSLIFGLHHVIDLVRIMSRGLGMMVGVFGYRYEEYRVVSRTYTANELTTK